MLVGLALSEALTVLTIFYFTAITAFNAGYFSGIGGGFVKLFSFNDLFTATIPLVQYAAALFVFYQLFAIIKWEAMELLGLRAWLARREPGRLRQFFSFVHDEPVLLVALIIPIQLVLSHFVIGAVGNIADHMWVEMIPVVISNLIGVYFCLWVYDDDSDQHTRNKIFWIWVNTMFFAFVLGQKWLKYEIKEPVQSIQLHQQSCVDRKIIKATEAGFLLYNPYAKQFEFRNKDEIRAIYQTRSCE